MSNNPPEARHADIIVDVLDALEANSDLVNRLAEGTDSIRPKNVLDKGDGPPGYETLVLVGLVGDAQTQRNVATVDADYLVQILVLRSDRHRRGSSSTWIYKTHAAISESLTHLSAGDSIPQGQSGGVEEQWSEQRNRWMSDKTFTYTS